MTSLGSDNLWLINEKPLFERQRLDSLQVSPESVFFASFHKAQRKYYFIMLLNVLYGLNNTLSKNKKDNVNL